MPLDPLIVAFWIIAALAAWTQTLTGFGLGLILMGATGALGLIPLPQAAVITSILVIVNTTSVLIRAWRHVDRFALRWLMIGAVPGLILGFWLLHFLSGGAVDVLRLLLGLVIAGAAVQMVLGHGVAGRASGPEGYLATGFGGAIMGGLFAASGPPVIWQMYRQPTAPETIRATLIAFFFLTQILRLILAGGSGTLDRATLIVAAGATPAVLAATWAARRFPPPITPDRLRQIALALLMASGVALILPAAWRMIA